MTIYRDPDGQHAIRRWCEQRLSAWGHPHASRTLETWLGATHVVTAGSGPAVVLLAGTNFASATWTELVAALAPTWTVHAVDLPGQPGLSAAQRPRSPRRRYGEWLAALLRDVGGSEATIVGHSLGAAVAMSAVASGGRAGRLLLIDPAGLMHLSVSASVLRPTMPWLRAPDERTSAGLLRMMMAPASTPDADLVTWMTLVGRHVRTSLAPRPLPSAVLGALDAVPVRVLTGRHDVFLPPARLRRSVVRRLRHADLHVVDDAGHLLPHEQPQVVVDHLRALTSSEGG